MAGINPARCSQAAWLTSNTEKSSLDAGEQPDSAGVFPSASRSAPAEQQLLSAATRARPSCSRPSHHVTWQLHAQSQHGGCHIPGCHETRRAAGRAGGSRGSFRARRNAARQRCRRTFGQKVSATSKSGTVPPSHSDGSLTATTPGAPPGRHGAGADAGEALNPPSIPSAPAPNEDGRVASREGRLAISTTATAEAERARKEAAPPPQTTPPAARRRDARQRGVSAVPPGCPAAGRQPPGPRSHRTAPSRAAPPGPATHTAPPWWTCCPRGGPKRLPQQRERRNAPARHGTALGMEPLPQGCGPGAAAAGGDGAGTERALKGNLPGAAPLPASRGQH